MVSVCAGPAGLAGGDGQARRFDQVGPAVLQAAEHGVQQGLAGALLQGVAPGAAQQAGGVLAVEVLGKEHRQVVQAVQVQLGRRGRLADGVVEFRRAQAQEALNQVGVDGVGV